MNQAALSRPDFLDWLGSTAQGRALLPPPPMSRSNKDAQIHLYWFRPDEEPLIAVPAAEMRDFLAFTSTYVGTHTPFSAFFRVVAKEVADQLMARDEEQRVPAEALIGALIAEASLNGGSNAQRLSEISIQLCLRCSSASVIGAALTGYNLELALAALDRWRSVRDTLRAATERVPARLMRDFWSNALGALSHPDGLHFADVDPRLLELVSAAQSGSDSDAAGINWLSGLLPGGQQIWQMLRASREDRVRALDRLRTELTMTGVDQERQDMFVGFAASMVAEGSFNYLPLTLNHAQKSPMAVIWFGFFAGLNPNSDVMTTGDCLGRRLFRSLASPRNSLRPIEADINYEEFLLLNQENRIPKIRTESRGL
ncbi:hypothetical protein H9L15_01240 [Sphingomonas daechungensis]|uniref:DUF4238 domain-containing protein n=1 Tax=Sphingomonas daechungensis TaxID=1176646 RepID=A0ABX6T3I6_9SPHN|nr:hypothetical protein [Sphingomonas daechungensis]QNP43467.1 hypothetical protein H9L15_01240 [Sphingomonas daechungensis]